MTALKTFNMLNVRLATDREASSLQPTDTELQAIERHDLCGVLADVMDETWEVEDTRRYVSFELRVSGENHD